MTFTEIFQNWEKFFTKHREMIGQFDALFQVAQSFNREAAESGYRLITNQDEQNDLLNILWGNFITELDLFEKDTVIIPKLSEGIRNNIATALDASQQLVHYWSRAPKT